MGKGFVNGVTISYDLWQRRFQGDPQVIGREVEINNLPMRVLGVLPQPVPVMPGARRHHSRIDIWYPRPLSCDHDDPFRGRIVIARLRREVTIENTPRGDRRDGGAAGYRASLQLRRGPYAFRCRPWIRKLSPR